MITSDTCIDCGESFVIDPDDGGSHPDSNVRCLACRADLDTTDAQAKTQASIAKIAVTYLLLGELVILIFGGIAVIATRGC